MTMSTERSGKAWEIVENEKKHDQLMKRVSFVALKVAAVLAAIVAVLIITRIFTMSRFLLSEGLGLDPIIGVITPMFISLGVLALVVAAVSTIGWFLRTRSARVSEIQLRLAALEDLLIERSDSGK